MAGYVGPAGDAVVGREDRTARAKGRGGCEKGADGGSQAPAYSQPGRREAGVQRTLSAPQRQL